MKNKLKKFDLSQKEGISSKEKPDPTKQPFGQAISREKIQKLMEVIQIKNPPFEANING